MRTPEGPICQSCGMPLSRDPQGGGTQSDGNRSAEYCSHCYQAGAFTQPDLTVDQMMSNVTGRLRELDLPPPIVDKLASGIPLLARWRTGS